MWASISQNRQVDRLPTLSSFFLNMLAFFARRRHGEFKIYLIATKTLGILEFLILIGIFV